MRNLIKKNTSHYDTNTHICTIYFTCGANPIVAVVSPGRSLSL